jgi:hypothetical protein
MNGDIELGLIMWMILCAVFAYQFRKPRNWNIPKPK